MLDASGPAQVRTQPHSLAIVPASGGEPLAVFRHGPDDPRPYLHPLRPLDGRGVLTEDAPSHHPWQHGLYTGLHDLGDSDFWFDHGQRPHAGRIDIGPCQLLAADAGGIAWRGAATWRSHVDDRPLLTETQTWRFARVESTWRLELAWTLSAAQTLAVKAHQYGGPFLRMPFRSLEGCRVISSRGLRDSACEQARAAWLCVTMPIDGRDGPAGFVVSSHPANADAEPVWRVDGQRGVGPVVVHQPLSLSAGEARTWRFGYTCITGEPSPDTCEQIHQHYCKESTT